MNLDSFAGTRRTLAACSLMTALLLAGCGGGGGGGSRPTSVMSVTIDWPDRGRSVSPPSSALSARFVIRKAAPNGANIELVANRNSNAAAHSETYTTAEIGVTGTRTIDAHFFADRNGTGDAVGDATFTSEIAADGRIDTPVTIESTIKKVEVDAGQFVFVGGSKTLVATAYTIPRAVVAVKPDAFKWAVTSGADRLRFVDGKAEGLLAGVAGVTASVDHITSTAVNVEVRSNDQ